MEEEEKDNTTDINKPKSKIWKDSNTLLTFSAIFISLATLFILIYQTSLASKQFDLEQKQQLASVMPYIQISAGHSTPEEFKIFITNDGIGPAFLKNIRVHYEGDVYENIDLAKFIINEKITYQGALYEYANIFPGNVIPANQSISHLRILKGKQPNIDKDIFYTGQVELEIEYASIYDERWIVRGLFNEPVKTKGIAE
ncbi:MAG TPA: hypothetical protein VK921_16030 [Anditalea sp.]|nr:hypothetical protein [Anditalea sp.]